MNPPHRNVSGSLYDQLSNERLLTYAFRCIQRGKKDRPGIKRFAGDDQGQTSVQQLTERLRSGEYHHGKLNRTEVDKDGDPGSTRPISSPDVEDRVVQRAILEIVATPLGFPELSGPKITRPDSKLVRSPFVAIEQLIIELRHRHYCLLESDISSFFDSIPKQKLFDEITKRLPDESLNKLIHDVIWFSYKAKKADRGKSKTLGIAQGSPLSPLFSDLYLEPFDTEIAKAKGTHTIRYVDDFIVVTDSLEHAKAMRPVVEKSLANLDLGIKECKTNEIDLRSDALTFLGLKIDCHSVRGKRTVPQLKERWKSRVLPQSIYQRGKYKNRYIQDRKEIIETVNERLMGWATYLAPYHAREQINTAYDAVQELITRRQRPNFPYLDGKLEDFRKARSKNHIINEFEWQSLFKK